MGDSVTTPATTEVLVPFIIELGEGQPLWMTFKDWEAKGITNDMLLSFWQQDAPLPPPHIIPAVPIGDSLSMLLTAFILLSLVVFNKRRKKHVSL